MKNKKVTSLLLAAVAAFSLCPPVFAASGLEDQVSVSVMDSSAYVDDIIALGRIEDGEGTLTVTDTPSMAVESSDIMPHDIYSTFLFSAVATNVKNLVATRASNKIITTNNTQGDIRVSANLTYSPTPSESQSRAIRAGLCTYNVASDEFETSPALYLLFEDGVRNSHMISRGAMKSGRNYYGFIKNLIGDNEHKVNGTVWYYDERAVN